MRAHRTAPDANRGTPRCKAVAALVRGRGGRRTVLKHLDRAATCAAVLSRPACCTTPFEPTWCPWSSRSASRARHTGAARCGGRIMTKHGNRARTRRVGLLALAVAACVVASDGLSQVSAQGFGRGRSSLTGTYRLNTSLSDNSSTLADQVTRSLPGRDRPRLRTQILRRLDAPEELAIERAGPYHHHRLDERGSRHVRSRRADAYRAGRWPRDADGRQPRRRSTRDQQHRRSVEGLSGDFEPLNGGRSLQVTRRVTDPGLSQPVVARSVYDRVSTDAAWTCMAASPLVTTGMRSRVTAAPARRAFGATTSRTARRFWRRSTSV